MAETKDPNLLDRWPNEKRRQTYIDAWYTNKVWDAYFYTPQWERTRVRYDGSLDLPENTVWWYEWDLTAIKLAEKNRAAANTLNAAKWWEITGSTVPQNTQNSTQNQNGTSVSNSNSTSVKYDGTDGKWNITVWPQNANLNYYQYWDDSNPNQQSQKWWMNDKYTGEWVSNTYIEYNPDVTLADLDPNYLYWENARQQNRKDAWYIARRNDMIASALYNEWKVSKEEVAEFLSQQNEWMNSTEADRLNTIESVWKRLWQIKPEEVEEEPQTDFTKDTSGKLYGKTTADEWNPKQWIDTLADDNSVFRAMEVRRTQTVDEMYNLWVDNLAAAKYYNTWTYGEQAWRDFSLRYPQTAALVEQKVKEMKAQETVNAVASGTDLPSNNNTVWSVNNNIADFSNTNATSTTSSAQITKNINTMLDNNETAQTAQELMWTIEWEMATLKNRLKNLREEANNAFKWDVPDYIVNAYINNRSQEIQNQLSILEDRYNAAYQRYTTEVSQAQRQQEFDLKKKQLEMNEKEFELKKWATEQWIEIDRYKAKWTTSTSNSWRELPVTTKTREEINWIVDWLVDKAKNWQLGKSQCAAWIQRYYFPELWITIWWLSTLEAKKWLINTDKYYVPQKWDLIIINSWAKLEDWTPAWHIGIVVSVDWDKLTYLDWNGDWQENVAVRTTSINSKSIEWYYDVTKWQSSSRNYEWTDQDYANFEAFLDTDKETRMNSTDKKAMAEQYWTDLQWMTILATDALANRDWTVDTSITVTPEWTISINEEGRTVITPSDWWEPIVYAYWVNANDKRINQPWFDPTLWYNTYNKDFYNEVNKNPDESKYTKQQIEEARNFADAQAKWKDWYDDEARWVDQEFWFIIDKKDAYQRIYDAMHSWKIITPNQKGQFIEELKLDPSNANAWTKVTQEVDAYRRWTDEVLEDEANELSKLIRATEYLIMQDATKVQRKLAIDDEWNTRRQAFWEAETWANAYRYIVDAETLEKLIDTKWRWWTLTPVSDKDISMIKNAATDIKYDDDSDAFKEKVTDFYIKLRKSIWKDISREDVYDMRNQEWAMPRLNYGLNWDFSNYLIIDHAHKTWIFWWWNYWRKKSSDEEKIKDTNTIWGSASTTWSRITTRANTWNTAMDDINNVINW